MLFASISLEHETDRQHRLKNWPTEFSSCIWVQTQLIVVECSFYFRKFIVFGSEIMLRQIKVLRPNSSFQIASVDMHSELSFWFNPAFELLGNIQTMLMLKDGSLEALLVGLCLVEACLTIRRLPRGFLSTACARYAALSYNFNFFLSYGFVSHPDPYELFDLFNMSQHFNNFFFYYFLKYTQ